VGLDTSGSSVAFGSIYAAHRKIPSVRIVPGGQV